MLGPEDDIECTTKMTSTCIIPGIESAGKDQDPDDEYDEEEFLKGHYQRIRYLPPLDGATVEVLNIMWKYIEPRFVFSFCLKSN
jgi:hypothetical protein